MHACMQVRRTVRRYLSLHSCFISSCAIQAVCTISNPIPCHPIPPYYVPRYAIQSRPNLSNPKWRRILTINQPNNPGMSMQKENPCSTLLTPWRKMLTQGKRKKNKRPALFRRPMLNPAILRATATADAACCMRSDPKGRLILSRTR